MVTITKGSSSSSETHLYGAKGNRKKTWDGIGNLQRTKCYWGDYEKELTKMSHLRNALPLWRKWIGGDICVHKLNHNKKSHLFFKTNGFLLFIQ